MAGINLNAVTGFTSATLVADSVQAAGGSNDAVSSLTAVNGIPVNAALEIQSTTGGLLLPRMTTAQKNALTTVVNGMEVFDTTLGSFSYYTNGVWGTSASPTGTQQVSVTLTQAQVQGMFATPVLLIAAPAAGYSIVVDSMILVTKFVTTAFANGGVSVVQYGTTNHGGGTNTLTATIPAAEITAAASQIYKLGGATATVVTGIAATGVYISNQTAAFTAGNVASTVVVNLNYRVVAANV